MRTTTKIITGIILSIFVISLTFITGFSFTDRKNYHRWNNSAVDIPQDSKTGIDTEPYRVIVLEREKHEQVQGRFYHIFAGDNCGLFLNSVTAETEKNKLFIPEVLLDFVSAKTCSDTLTVTINVEALSEKYAKGERSVISFTGINLYLHTSRVDVVNKLLEIPTVIRNIETDTVKVSSGGHIHIESCTARVIKPLKSRSFKINDCKIDELNIDLDLVTGNWNVENCTVGTENFTGGGNHSIILTKDESKKINWIPKNKKAKLNVTLPGDTTQFVYH
ncbi:MAG: hypothetical protein LBC47_02950 [Tannerella sp.]|jgi:hypothetical protein|nr:hypothetical protein [Tannerella sp.]